MQETMKSKFKNIKPGLAIILMTITICFMADFTVYGLKNIGVDFGGGFGREAQAAEYYVAIDGSDENSGTSQSSPWDRCPGMVGWTGSAALEAGDTVYFNNSDIWNIGGGIAGLYVVGGVTYDGSTWGSGTRATINVTDSFSQGAIYIRDDHAIYETVVKGFHIDANDLFVHAGINLNRISLKDLIGATKRIEDCVVHDIQPSEVGYGYGIVVSATFGYHTDNVEVLNCTVYNIPRTGINVYLSLDHSGNQANNVIVRGCEVYNTGEDPSSAGNGIMLKNHSVNSIVEYNYIHNTSGRGISIHASTGMTGPENAKVRYNIITDCGKDGIDFEYVGTTSVDVYGNLIYNNNRAGILFMSNMSGDKSIKIYNNTLYQNNNDGQDRAEIEIDPSSANFITLEIKNNILYPISGNLAISGSGITSQSNNLTTNPNFKNISNLPTGFSGTYGVDMQPDKDGLSIESGEAIDNGADLGTVYNGAINLAGKSGGLTRPLGDGWDIGAYEYVSTTEITPPTRSNPDNFTLQQNYPNPFNPSTKIKYSVAKLCNVQIIIYNRLGQEICVLVNEQKSAGEYNVRWDGKNYKGNKLASGVYFYRLTAGKQVDTKKMLYLR